MAKDLRARMRELAATKSAQPTAEAAPKAAPETPFNLPVAQASAPLEPSAELAQPSALSQQAILDKANQAVIGAIQKQGPSESARPAVPSLSGAMQRLAVAQKKAEEELAAGKTVQVKELPKPVDPSLKSPGELSLLAKAKALKETGEQYVSVFPNEPWPESRIENFDADAHLTDLKLLEQQLLTDEELLPVLMIRVHQNLKQYEELAHLLDEDQIQVIVGAFAKRKSIEIVAAASGKSASTKGRSVQAITKDLSIEQILGML